MPTRNPTSLPGGSAAAALIALLLICGVTGADVNLAALTNGGSLTSLGAPLTENFDSLASAGTGIAWADNSTIPGWYSTRATYNAGTGSSNTGALYSFGVAGAGPVTDRALGSVASGSTLTIYQAGRLTNNTGATITALDISYVGEQWRSGGNTAAHTLTFQYQVAPVGVVTGANSPTAGWTTFSPLSFTGPIATATAAALDGNDTPNRTAIAATLIVTVNPGQEIWLRWADPDDGGSDHGLAIDDFSVVAQGLPGDSAPSVTGTTPAGGATNVPVASTIVVNFSESVTATVAAFALVCPSGSPQPFVPSASPAASFTLTPAGPLPPNTTCTVTVAAGEITDSDASDPPDQMPADVVFSFTTGSTPPPAATNVLMGGTGANGDATTIADGRVNVPAFTWKVALVLPKGDLDLGRVSCSTRTIGVIMPNVQGIRDVPWENYLTTVDAVEALTGYNFFSDLSLGVQHCIEAGLNGNNPGLDTTPPAIAITAPANGAVYELHQIVSAAYACTDGESGVASCTGTVANLSAIDTSSVGVKTFVVTAADASGNLSSLAVTYEVRRTLSAVGPANIWIGLKDSEAAGLRLDLRTELLVNGTVRATGTLLNIPTGSSGFDNAILNTVEMALASGPVEVAPGAQISLRVSVRRTCSGGGQNSGRVRHWFNGQPIDSGANRDAGSRIQLTIGGTTSHYFLRTDFGLSTSAGVRRLSVEATVNSSVPCNGRPYTVLGTWVVIVP